MKRLVIPIALLTILHLAWGQDIVLKASFNSTNQPGRTIRIYDSIDVNSDGIPELPMGYGYVDTISLQVYRLPEIILFTQHYPQDFSSSVVSKIRQEGLAEWVSIRNVRGIFDIASGDLIFSFPDFDSGPLIYDYDNDGLDDVIIETSPDLFSVYGIATGNPPISPPQELDIQQVGQDYIISWTSVPTATAYRIEWSSALDGGVRFTRIGYTTGTTFTHRDQAGQERGFYRVLSEDNGMGVVRMVGASSLGK